LLVATVFFLVIELHDASALAPLAQFFLPVGFHGCWDYNKHLFDHFCIEEPLEIGSYLHCLSQTHVVAQNSTLAGVPQLIKPLDTKLLVIEKTFVDI
jgi:hypothetical protein